MSVINRMLKELEERREDVMQTRIPGLVRAVPARGARALKSLPWPMLGGVMILLLIALLSWRISSQWHADYPPTPPPPPPPGTAMPLAARQSVLPEAPALHTEAVLSAAPAIPAAPASERKIVNHVSSPAKSAPRVIIADAIPAAPAESAREPEAPAISAPSIPTPAKSPSEKNPSEKSAPEGAPSGRVHRQELAVTEKVEILKSAPGGETPLSSMKQVSKEQRADFRYREALALITQGRVQEAQTALDETLRLDPRNFPARQVLLGLLLEAKRYPEAEQLLQDALQNNLAPANNAIALARVQIERGEQAAALSTLEKYLPQAGGAAAYHGFYAALLQRAGRHAEAITQFQSASRAQPNQANWWLGLGVSLQSEKRNPEAEQAYQHARGSNTLSPELQAFIEQRLKQLQAARP